MNGLYEILTNKFWMAAPHFVHGVRATIQQNLNGRIAIDLKDKRPAARAFITSRSFEIEERRYSAKDGTPIYDWRENKDDPFISLLYADGPITRNGDGCSYGSIELRDLMMEAANNANCVGHVFYINTPGGSAWAKNDFQQAIEYAHSKRQPVIAFIDGMCCSAGMYLAALCDERYYMHPKDEVGCIGVMAAFYTIADGSHNQFDDTTYHEIYDPNKEIRDIANDNNDELMIDELKKLGVEFRADVKKACPKATDEHLKGKVFDAEEVEGILMTGQSDLGGVFARVIKISADNGVQAGKNAQQQTIFNNKQNVEIMDNKYQTVASLMGVEELVVTNEGTNLDVSLLDTLQTNIEALQAEAAKVADLTKQLADAQQALTDANTAHETALAAKDTTIAQMQQTATESTERIQQLEENLNGVKASLTTAEQTIAERDQAITDLNARITELEHDPGDEPAAGSSPANNGEGAQANTVGVLTKVAKRGQTYEEMCAEWDRKD